jgi:glycosyltransferase involved in cell wall biosynthesis
MKVVFVIATLPTGGAQMVMLRLLERLHPRFTPHVISLSTIGEIGSRIQALGVPIEALGMRPGVPSLSAFLRLVRRLREVAPDIVHTWMYHADLLGGVAAKFAGVPRVVWAIRQANLDADKNKLSTLAVVRACALLSSRVPSKILSNSVEACDVHVAHGYAKEKMVVIPNGFDLRSFLPDAGARSAVRCELRIPPAAPIIGWVGRFHPHKNVAGFFEAAARLHSQLPNVHFVLAGEGLEFSNAALVREVQRAGVTDVTHLLGIRKDVAHLMAAMDVLASSSSGEAFSNVIGEAMACGVPCAVTNVGDSAHIIGDTGGVVDATDMSGLADRLREIVSLPAEDRAALGARARERIAAYFEIGNMIKQYEALYDRMPAGAP